MAIDYSNLSDEELTAIANDDYSTLSDKTLRQLTRDPSAQAVPTVEPSVNIAPQAAGVARQVAPSLAQGAMTAAKTAASIPKDWYDIGKIVYNNANLNTVGQFIKEPWKLGTEAVGAYVQGHPVLGQITSATPKQAVGALAQGARGLGGALLTGAMAPESALMMPYQMAAYEQEKIRANPNAPEYATNPYAQAYRGEYATQGQAGAANRRQAIANMPYGNVNPQERAILDQDRIMRETIRKKAYDRVTGPVAPGPIQ